MSRALSLIVLIGLLTIAAEAAPEGINTVGKGGGFAEMIAVMMDRTLPRHLEACLSNEELCHINSEQAGFAKTLIADYPRLSGLPLRFHAECLAPFVALRSDSLEIASCALYNGANGIEPKAKSLEEITLTVLAGRLMQWEQVTGQKPVPLESLFRGMTMSDDSSAVPLAEGRAELHVILFKKNWYEQTRSLLLEAPNGTIDLSDELPKLLCPDNSLTDWVAVFDRNTQQESKQVLFQGESTWHCRRKAYRARLAVYARLNSALVFVPESIVLRVSQKEEVEF